MNRILRSTFFILLFGLVGCAGPMTPFGGLNSFILSEEPNAKDRPQQEYSGPQIRFTPHRQVLHGSTSFSVNIFDIDGIPENFGLKVIYNNIDVTQQFLAKSEKVFLDRAHRKIRMTLGSFRLISTKDNSIKVSYWREFKSQAVTAEFQPPRCSAFETFRRLVDLPNFGVDKKIVEHIDLYSRQRNFNPYFMAGLIAQESKFDSRAVSTARAIGLTQVTRLGEAEIIKKYSNWPRYPGIHEMSFLRLKLGILNGKINQSNEWRLDPTLSILGGVEYVTYLAEQWTKPERRAFVEKHLGRSDNSMSEVILASYNSGATRVSNAIEQGGKKWLKNEELGEARKYVKRVVSYCDYFATGDK